MNLKIFLKGVWSKVAIRKFKINPKGSPLNYCLGHLRKGIVGYVSPWSGILYVSFGIPGIFLGILCNPSYHAVGENPLIPSTSWIFSTHSETLTHLNQVKVSKGIYLYTSQAEHTYFWGRVVFCYPGAKFWFLNAHYCMGCYRPPTALWPEQSLPLWRTQISIRFGS